MSQDQPEVQSSGVPVPSAEEDRFVKNKDEMERFSLDMPWNPIQGALTYYAPEW